MDESQFLHEINAIPWEQPAGNEDYHNALLVFADWLEEQGDLRCELIRLREGLLNDPTPKQRLLWEPRMQALIHQSVQPIQAVWQNSIGMKFCWCPPGKFMMGSPKMEVDRDDNEDQVEVTLTQGFWLGKYEVTQAEYEKVMGKNPSWFSATGSGKSEVADQDTSRFPVEHVSWLEAEDYLKKLTEQERAAGRLPTGWEFRLPTEAQWVYACRAGTTTATAFGDSLSSKQANFDGNYPYNGAEEGPVLKRTCEVGSYPANAWGLHDLHGNVWEWCQDWYADNLPGGTDPPATQAASYRVNRGGSWSSYGGYCRSAYRNYYAPGYRFLHIGFRVAIVQSR